MRNETNYWARRASRRRFLGTGVAAGAGAAGLALVGCGDDDGGSKGGSSSLATPTTAAGATPTAAPADPFAGAKRGGTYRWPNSGDPPTLDPYGNPSFLTKEHASAHYSRLFRYQAGKEPLGVKPIPDIAASAESSPDGLKWTVKLRQDVKFHNIAPVNGRQVTTDDVKFSWGRVVAPTNGNRVLAAFVDKLEYPDKSTIVFSLPTV